MSASPNLKLPFLDPNQNQKSVTHNAALTVLDALVNLHVATTTLQAPPASPNDGQCWIVASGATGAWAGKDLNIAAWQDGAWSFYAPNPGFVAYVDALQGALMWNGTAWVSLLGAITSLALAELGIGTAADPSNPLSAKLNAALFAALPTTANPAGSGDVRVKLSKQATGNTASLLFQDAFSERAEIGLLADDNLHLKVSPDGTTFSDALVIAAGTGAATFLATPTHPSPAANDASLASATTAWVAAKGYVTAAGAGSAAPVQSVAGRTGAVTLGVGDVSGAAPLASPALTGTPTAPNAAAGTNTNQVATTSFVAASFVTYAYAGATYATASNATLTGTPTAPTPAAGDTSTRLATTAFVATSYAPLASPALSGTPTAPNAAAGTNTNQVATTSFVAASFVSYAYAGATYATASNATLTGTPTAPTPAAGDTSTRLATTAFVATSYAPLASPALTGTPTAPNAAAGTNTNQVATTSFVAASFVSYAYAGATYATASNATLTGTPTAPTQSAKDNSTRLATTAYADRAVAASIARTQVSDAAYTVLLTDRTVAVIALTAARVLSLPAASAYPQGATLTIVDESGACSATNMITIAAAGSDTVNGGTAAVLAAPYGYLALESNGSNKWTVIDQPSGAVAALNGGPLAGQRNRIVNGNFAVNQRAYASNTALAAGAYGHDRWKAGTGGCTYTFTAGTPDTAVTVTAGSLQQVVETANVEGGVYTLSWTGTATGRVTYTPTGGSITTTAYAASPIVLPAVNAGLAVTVEFGTGTLGKVQLEPGAVTTPFERRPLGDELRLCMRYFRKIGGTGSAYYKFGFGFASGSTTVPTGLLGFYVPMRATPTVGSSGSFSLNGTNSLAVTSITFDQGDQYGVSIVSGVSGSASGFYLLQASNDGTANITLTAEL